MNYETINILVSFATTIILALVIIPILKRRWAKESFKKARNTDNGRANIHVINNNMCNRKLFIL